MFRLLEHVFIKVRSAAVSHVQVIGTRVYKGKIGAVVNILSPKRNDT